MQLNAACELNRIVFLPSGELNEQSVDVSGTTVHGKGLDST